jgi:hypothetical protein
LTVHTQTESVTHWLPRARCDPIVVVIHIAVRGLSDIQGLSMVEYAQMRSSKASFLDSAIKFRGQKASDALTYSGVRSH